MPHSIAILIPYFGRWPAWMPFFLESCRTNPDIDWLLFSDCGPVENRPPNVRIVETSFADYKRRAADALGMAFDPPAPYKLCDLRPALAFIHREELRGYDFAGYGDLDVIYGRIRDFYDEQTLGLYDALSTHPERVSGHFFLMRNREPLVTAFRTIPDWRRRLLDPEYRLLDEGGFMAVFKGRRARLRRLLRARPARYWFREAYSTPSAASTVRWLWREGILSNETYPHRSFLYLHFMAWHSPRWLSEPQHRGAGTACAWDRLDRLARIGWREARAEGFAIGPDGFGPIEESQASSS